MVTKEQIDYATDVYTAKRQVYDTSGRLVEHKRLWADGSALFPSLKNPKTFMWFTKLRNGGKLTTEQVIQFLGRHGLQSIYQDAQAYEKKGRDAEDLLDELRQIGSIMDTLYKMGGELTPEELGLLQTQN
ncbi:MAG: hypothetical protein FWD89_01940 [Firmicutes bacterium]|nr:hypothetical protein [Bacillota bacterium]